MEKIPESEIRHLSLTHIDPHSRLFEWRGQLYRGIITAERAELYRSLFESGVVSELCRDYSLIESEMTKYKTEEYELIIHHPRLPVVSYCHEWSASMLKDAALCSLRLEAALQHRGYTLQDGHPWNILFHRSRPVFVDFGSIVPWSDQNSWRAEHEFREKMFYPLILFSERHHHVARCLMRARQGISYREYLCLARKRMFFPFKLSRFFGVRGNMRSRPVEWYMRKVEKMRMPTTATTWSGYYDNASEQDDPKHESIEMALKVAIPKSVTDLGANTGRYSLLAAKQGARVVALDSDELCMDKLYRKAKESAENIHPIVMDIMNPTAAEGPVYDWFPAATNRFRSKLVMANALIHHLVFKKNLDFQQILAMLSSYGTHWLLVEFVDRGDKYVKEWIKEHHAWYCRENFEKELRANYAHIQMFPSNSENRTIYLCGR